MKASTIALEPRSERPTMGKVTTDVLIVNRIEEALGERGLLPADDVRSVRLHDVLVDTGATTLCLPTDMIATLGLTAKRTVEVLTATGPAGARIFQDVRIEILGRTTVTDCLELPAGSPPLLGVLPLEALGLEPDLRRRELRVLPDEGPDSYYTAL